MIGVAIVVIAVIGHECFRNGRVNIKQDETTTREQRDKPDYYLVSNSWPWERVQPTHSSLSWDLSQASAQREAALAWRLPMKQESQGRFFASPAVQQVGGIVDQGIVVMVAVIVVIGVVIVVIGVVIVLDCCDCRCDCL